MRFLIDECTGPAVARWLRAESHEVFSVFDEARGMSDDDILGKCVLESWILITNDKDFVEMVNREKRPHRGVIFLRLQNESPAAKIAALQRLLPRYAGQITDAFVVVTETRVRLARM